MRHRLAILSLALVLLAPAAAIAQDGNPFDGQIPPAQPTPAPTPQPVDTADDDAIGTTTLWIIGGGVAIALLIFGFWISRDARSSLSEKDRDHLRGVRKQDGELALPHKHERAAKAKARAKGRAQRQARKAHRKKGAKAKR
jgi:hypothetical protein